MALRNAFDTARDRLPAGVAPAVLGAVAALVFILAVALSRSAEAPTGETVARAPQAVATGNEAQAKPRPQPQQRALLDLFLPPRPSARDQTRRIENGLPGVDRSHETLARPAPREKSVAAARDKGPAIALVIDDMGFDKKNSDRAVGLPAAVTLSYLPTAPEVGRQVRGARLRGHDVMLHLPMEADDHHGRPGVNVLSVAQERDALQTRLNEMLHRFGGYIGVNNHQGSRFTRDRDRMGIVLRELRRRGMFFLDSRTSGGSIGAELAQEIGLPHAARDVFLDHDPSRREIRERMREAEALALSTGRAVVIAHPRTATMDMVEPWLAALSRDGIRLVPVASVLTRPQPAPPKRLAHNQATE